MEEFKTGQTVKIISNGKGDPKNIMETMDHPFKMGSKAIVIELGDILNPKDGYRTVKVKQGDVEHWVYRTDITSASK